MGKSVMILEEKFAHKREDEEEETEEVQQEEQTYGIKKEFTGLHIDFLVQKSRRLNKAVCDGDRFIVLPYEASPTSWFQREPCVYAFSHPKIRSRLEHLMGANLVRLTDRNYMLQLHERILEDYIEQQNKRIADREAQELEREKDLILDGIIPFEKAPQRMSAHPLLLIHNYCKDIIDDRRARIKVPQVYIPMRLYWDDTPDPPYFLSICEGHVFRKCDDWLCLPPEIHLQYNEDEDIKSGYMFTADDYAKKQKFEHRHVKYIARSRTVEKMYETADEIVGFLKTINKG